MAFKRVPLLVATSLALALPFAAHAQYKSKVIDWFKALAGSQANAASLADGAGDARQVTPTSPDGKATTTSTPKTGKIGNGSMENARLLARESLRQKGITNPTPEQLKAALDAILQQRAEHKGWGEIAHSMGVKLGDLRRNEHAAERREQPERVERAERRERPERPERHERIARGGR